MKMSVIAMDFISISEKILILKSCISCVGYHFSLEEDTLTTEIRYDFEDLTWNSAVKIRPNGSFGIS